MEPTRTISQLVNEIRSEYITQFGKLNFGSIRLDCSSTLESWICDLIDKYPDRSIYQEWREILEGIDVTEFEHLELFHYTDFSVIYGEWNPEDYWNAFGGIYRTCRSTVIDLETGVTVIKPFDKFFNVNELPETSQDNVEDLINTAKTIEISEKLDGSIVCVSRRPFSDYSGVHLKSYVCTSQSLDPDTSWHLAMAKSMLEKSEEINRMLYHYPNWTFMFEMIASEDTHVVFYPDSERGLHLIGARTPDGRLLKYSEIIHLAQIYGIKTTQVFNKSFEQVMSELDDKKSDEAEGFVIRIDDAFFKLKYNDYVTMHKTLTKLVSATGIIAAYKEGTIDDLMAKVPLSYREQVTGIVNEIKICISEVNRVCQHAERECAKIPEFRDKMIWIQNYIPKILRGYCIDAVKGKSVSIFRGNRVMRLANIRHLSMAAATYVHENIHRPDNPYYITSPQIAGNDDGEFLNFGSRTNLEENYNY